jgi:hypothetical protein
MRSTSAAPNNSVFSMVLLAARAPVYIEQYLPYKHLEKVQLVNKNRYTKQRHVQLSPTFLDMRPAYMRNYGRVSACQSMSVG